MEIPLLLNSSGWAQRDDRGEESRTKSGNTFVGLNAFKFMVTASVNESSQRRFAIAKEMYHRGVLHSSRYAVVDAMLSIINFDFTVETLMKTVILDTGGTLNRKSGTFKWWDEIRGEFSTHYKNTVMLVELDALHELRNDVQHGTAVPSPSDIERHKSNVKRFFGEICVSIYNNAVTFETISMAYLVKSAVERQILQSMETAIEKGDYASAVLYCKQCALYHKHLVRENLEIPGRHHFTSSYDLRNISRELADYAKDQEEKVKWLIDRVALREYHDLLEEVIGDLTLAGFQREKSDRENAEKLRTMIYNIITGTQAILTKKEDLEDVYVYDFDILNKEDNACTLTIGLASSKPIVNPRLEIQVYDKTVNGSMIFNKIGELKLDNSHRIQVQRIDNLEKGKQYKLLIAVEEQGVVGHRQHNFTM